MKRAKEEGFVYFIETEDGRYVKIGYSANVKKRFADLHTSRPDSLRCIGWMPGSRDTEAALHAKLASHRGRGEWFRDSPELREFIAELPLQLIDTFKSYPEVTAPPIVARRPKKKAVRHIPALPDAPKKSIDYTLSASRMPQVETKARLNVAIQDALSMAEPGTPTFAIAAGIYDAEHDLMATLRRSWMIERIARMIDRVHAMEASA